MPPGGQSAVGRERHGAPGTEPALLDALLGLALTAEAEQLVVLQLLDHEGVVHLHELDALGPEADLLVEMLCGVAAHLCGADHRTHEEMPALVHLAAEMRGGDAHDRAIGLELLRQVSAT